MGFIRVTSLVLCKQKYKQQQDQKQQVCFHWDTYNKAPNWDSCLEFDTNSIVCSIELVIMRANWNLFVEWLTNWRCHNNNSGSSWWQYEGPNKNKLLYNYRVLVNRVNVCRPLSIVIWFVCVQFIEVIVWMSSSLHKGVQVHWVY